MTHHGVWNRMQPTIGLEGTCMLSSGESLRRYTVGVRAGVCVAGGLLAPGMSTMEAIMAV